MQEAQRSEQFISRESLQPAYDRRGGIGLVAGPLAFVIMLVLGPPAGMSQEALMVAATTIWIAIWWMSEALPIPVTALLPIVILPITGALSVGEVTAGYSNPLIFVFLGGFMIALALERWNLHRRIALHIIAVVGSTPSRIVLGFMVATGFLSMWISNTATAMMMVPMGMAVVTQLATLKGKEHITEEDLKQGKYPFGTALMLGIAYSASIGGIATLVGTPPNIVLAGAASELLNIEITFVKWMMIGTPIAIIGLFGSWFYLTRFAYKISTDEIPGGLEVVRNEIRNLGPMSQAEKGVLLVFGLVALGWITRPWLIKPFFPEVNDAVIAIAGAVVLFAIPVRRQDNTPAFLMDWEAATRLPWGIVLLFGGGLAIADAFKITGLAQWLGESLGVLSGAPFIVITLAVVAMVIFLTEVTSNTASTTLLMPVMAALGAGIGINPLLLMVPTAIAASCAFMLPVATPPNAIVFGSGQVSIPQMARAGVWLNLCGVVLITLLGFLWQPLL